MTSELRVEWLAEHLDAVDIVAAWEKEEWGHLMPEVSLQQIAHAFRMRANRDCIPATLLGYRGDELVGTVSLVRHDMPIRKELSPWMAIVYAPPSCRGQGIGSALVRSAMQKAAGFGVDTMYLFTHDQMSFYERLGWRIHEQLAYRGEPVTIMSCSPGDALCG